jgi:DNA-binding CsgD family transcriptional regulator
MFGGPWVSELVGREGEIDAIERGLTATAAGDGRWVSIVGAPGIGKTSLLDAAAAEGIGRSLTVLRAAGSQAERHLGFAVLHQLLVPLLAAVDQLPSGHAAALRTAFGFENGSGSADRFHVALAALELLGDAAAESPVLAVVDDLHWADEPSREAITFIGRRLGSEPIALITAMRPGGRAPGAESGAVTIDLAPLSRTAAAELLRRHSPDLPGRETRRFLRQAAGNPLALRELPLAASLSGAVAAGLDGEPALTTRLERAFADRLSTLSGDAQTTLLVAAVQDGEQVSDTVDAAALLVADPSAAVREAVEAEVISVVRGRLRFRHPLIRSAVIQAADHEASARAHTVLAEVLSARSGERAVWHRAAASGGADERLAAELERNAELAYGEGRGAAATPWLVRAAELSAEGANRAHRLLRAAEISFELGDHDAVASLVVQAGALPLGAADAARLAGLNSAFDDGVPGDADTVQGLTRAAGVALGHGERDLAASLLVVAARSQYWRGAPVEQSAEIRDQIEAVALSREDPRRLNALALLDAYGEGASIAAELDRWAARHPSDAAITSRLAQAAFVIGEFDQSLWFAAGAVSALRQQGRIALLAQVLVLQTFAALYLGRWDIAYAASHEARQFAAETRQPIWGACAELGRANVGGLRGDADIARRLADEVERTAFAAGNASLLNGVQLCRGLTALGRGESSLAYQELARMFDRADPAYQSPQSVWAVDFLAEAARGCGRFEEARQTLSAVTRLVGDSPARGARRAMTLAAALLAEDDEAESAFAAAQALEPNPPAWYRARLDLGRGMWLRRQQRVSDSRLPLGAAQTRFAALGATAWASRAASELAATGQRVDPSRAATWTALSPQELLVAQLAAKGLTNREIGSQLFLSHRTVGSHLYRIFPKLGVRNRAQLSDALRERQM